MVKAWKAPSAVGVVFTDASATGFAGYTVEHGCHIAHGQWKEEERAKSSTWRQLTGYNNWQLSFKSFLTSAGSPFTVLNLSTFTVNVRPL